MKKVLFRAVQVLIVISILLGTCSCANRESEHSDGSMDSSQKPIEQTELSLADSTSLGDISVSTDAPKESVTRDNYLGEILDNPDVIDVNSLGQNCYIGDLGYCTALNLGFDNDITKDALRKYFGDDTLNISDISYFQDIPGINNVHTIYSFDEDISSPEVKTSLNIARYFLEENGYTFITDEIPASFFKENFPDLIEEYPINGIYLFAHDDFSYDSYFEVIDEDFENVFVYSDDINTDRKCLYYSLGSYNDIRRSLMNQWGVKQERCLATIDGQEIEINRLKYDADQYNRITEKLKEAYGYEISILEPETLENLKADGLNVENFEDFYNKVCGGTDFTYETYYSIKDRVEDQRSRG